MAHLTKHAAKKPELLTNRLEMPFVLCFKYKLENGYTLSDMKTPQFKELQVFLDRVSQMTFSQVERRYRRNSDKGDIFEGEQVIHYGIGETFRIHGIIENGQFIVLRLDPQHKYHR